MAKRQKILGLPIGPRRRSPVPKMVAGGTALVAVPAVVMPAISKISRAVKRGRDFAGKATDIVDTASDVKQAVSEKRSLPGKVGAVITQLKAMGSASEGAAPRLSHVIEQHIDIAVPRDVAYDQWTQFEMFPAIMKGVQSVHQEETDKLDWTSKIGPSRRGWRAEITEQVPGERLAWKSTGGANHRGVVTFHRLDDNLTRLLVEMQYDPTGFFEMSANTLRIQRRRVKRDLRLYKHFLELRGEETGAWRGRIDKQQSGRSQPGRNQRSRRSSSPAESAK
jgi:uncharacterized membrane protein